jgi:protein TonB
LTLTIALTAPFISLSATAYPRQSIPGVRSAVIECDVTADQLTSNCGYPPSKYWTPGPHDLAVAKDVNVRPARLAGATPGAKVKVVVRRNPWTQTTQPPDWTPAPPADGPSVVVDPVWRLMPPAEILKEFYPDRAMRLGINGDATAACTVGPSGDLVGCWLSSESPGDQGFGFALLKITTCVQIDPVTKGGLSAPGRTIKVGAHFTVSKGGAFPGGGAFAVQLVLLTA